MRFLIVVLAVVIAAAGVPVVLAPDYLWWDAAEFLIRVLIGASLALAVGSAICFARFVR